MVLAKTAKKTRRILGIETSCDETSVAILDVGSRVRLVKHLIASQIPVHQLYGGVVPEVAARLHVAETVGLLDKTVFDTRGDVLKGVDAIAVANGPGLATALRVGIDAARTLAWIGNVPIVGVNHLEGHLASAWLVPANRKRWTFPLLALLVSGGHTELILMNGFCQYQVIGRTRDDAAGEAFDKTAKLMGLPYPGGPQISKRAVHGNGARFTLPRPMRHDGSFDFSFSGLKTAVRNVWSSLSVVDQQDTHTVDDICASIQEAIVDVLVEKTIAAARAYRPTGVMIVGGVSANQTLYARMRTRMRKELPDVHVLRPARGFHTDNAAMIAAAGSWRAQVGAFDDWQTLDAEPEKDL